MLLPVESVNCVLDKEGALLFPVLEVEGSASKVLGDFAQLSVLKGLPQVVGDVEQHALKPFGELRLRKDRTGPCERENGTTNLHPEYFDD